MPARLTEATRGLGPSIIREMNRRKGPETLDLTLGQPVRGPEAELLDGAVEAYRSGAPGYTENAGLPELRAAIGAHHGRSADEVIVTVGSEQAVYLALAASVAPGDEVLIPCPGYPAYPGIVRMLGATPVPYPVDAAAGRVPDPERIAALASDRTRALIWNTPSNPFGTIPDLAITRRVVELAEARGWTVLSDEIYRDLRYDEAAWVSPGTLDPGQLLIGGLSKSNALTGFRIGYLIGPTDFVRQAILLHQLMVTCAPRLSQLMALEIFRTPERLRAHVPIYAEARRALEARAGGLPAAVPLRLGEGAFYATLELAGTPAEGRAHAWALEALEAVDVAVVPGIAFGGADDFWRLSYACGAEVVGPAFERLGRFLSERI